MEGLAPVKDSVNTLLKLVVNNSQREEMKKPILDVVINRVFLGNPGTGKTTVAKLYGQILTEMGLLSKGDVVIKCPSDFVGDVIGSSEKQTRDILKAAEGCVLVIDEAYCLYSGSEISKQNDPFKTAVIDTLVEQIQAKPGDDRAVILLGYRQEIERMFKSVNPGLARRFQLENAFEFPDYDDSSLFRILITKARKDGLEINLKVAKQAVASLAKQRAKPNFGNAGAVENMLSAAKLRLQQRGGGDTLAYADFNLSLETDDASKLSTLLCDMVGCEAIKNQLEVLKDTVQFSKQRGDDPKEHVCFNYLFLGNPGTGKTTVARRMGKLFKGLGLLPDDTVKEVSASDLITGYVGQAGQKTRDMLQVSRGGVLFIDEAYQLNPSRGGSYMTEVVDELVKGLTSPEFQGRMLVILAGYDQDMEDMLTTNPGLKSRFAERLHFPDMNANAAADLMAKKMKSRGLAVQDGDLDELIKLAEILVQTPDFGNGRDVDTWSAMSFQQVAISANKKGLKGKSDQRTTVSIEELESALIRMLQQRKFPVASASCAKSTVDQAQTSKTVASSRMSASSTKVAKVASKSAAEEVTSETEPNNAVQLNWFDSVDKKVLTQLQQFLTESELNTEAGVEALSLLKPSDPAFADLVSQLVAALDMTHESASEQLLKWQAAHQDLRKELERQKQKELSNTMRAIWRCGVCGRADKPWIACYVAPYIAYYEPVPAAKM